MKFLENEFSIELEGSDSNRDYIQLSDGEWLLKNLQPGSGSGKGKNSCVFRAVHPEGGADVIVKFCRFPHGVQGDDEVKRRRRFYREIDALKKASGANLGDFLITFFEDGECQIGKHRFQYYVMEVADYDLAEFLEKNTPTLQQKMLLCSSILRALLALHEKLGSRRTLPSRATRIWKLTSTTIADTADATQTRAGSNYSKLIKPNYYTPIVCQRTQTIRQ